jgi:ubiquinone/menaquinone biosynthesis C-methylase UbiE
MKTMLKLKNDPERIRSILVEHGVGPGMKILDYGAGIGNYSFEASKLVGNEGSVLAVDILETMVFRIEKEAESRGLKNISTLKIDHFTDIHKSGFDIVLLIDVLHMMDQQNEAISYLLEGTGPEGKVLLKLDHMNEAEIGNLMDSIDPLKKTKYDNNWWMIENSGT